MEVWNDLTWVTAHTLRWLIHPIVVAVVVVVVKPTDKRGISYGSF